MDIYRFLKSAQIVAVVCNQWGDTGKGKIVHMLTPWADVIARGTGGANAGHTVMINDKQIIFHLLPSGIVYDKDGKVNILGNGMVIDIKTLCQELDELTEAGYSYDHLMISLDAHVVMPYHFEKDRLKYQSQANGGIGSTGRGIGPSYADKGARQGIMIKDLFHKDILTTKIENIKPCYPEQKIDTEAIIDQLTPHIQRTKDLARDTISEIHQLASRRKKILLEGAQGLLLSIEYGTYPYVTSSDCSLNGTAAGVGISAQAVDRCLGLVNFPYMKRVGGGPFPTEIGAQEYQENCALNPDYLQEYELKQYSIPFEENAGQLNYDSHHSEIIALMNSSNPFQQSVGIRLAAREFGATTRRPRRPGWTDAVAAKYAVGINGPEMILTKPDCLAGINEFNICYGYNDGGSHLTNFDRDCKFLERVQPTYKAYDGYGDISKVRAFGDLPESLRLSINDFEDFTSGKASMVSVGPKEDEIIFV
jgi:adenylosuccinate synthase